METPMKSVNKICMSVLLLGAAAIAVPALAQDANSANNNASAAESAQAAAPSNENAQPAAAANQSSNTAADASTSPSAAPSANTQTAMNSSSNAAANADVSSVGDTSKKYHRATRAKDFRAEQKITAQLNQQASAAAKPTQTASNQ
jgi:hypothetical protein